MKSAIVTAGVLGFVAILSGASSMGLSGCATTAAPTDFGTDDGGATDDGGVVTKDGGKKDSGGTTGNDSGGGTGDCSALCAKATGTNCNQTTCMNNCQNPQGLPANCQTQYNDVVHCGATTGTVPSCSSSGALNIQGCDSQIAALTSCIQGGGTDGGTGGDAGANCGLTLNKPACDSCLAQNCCSQEMACANDSKCVPLNQCLAACAQGDTACENACYAGPNGSAKSELDAFYTCLQNSCLTPCQ